MGILLFAIFLIYCVGTVVSGMRTARQFRGRRVDERQRLSVYRQSVILSWSAALCMLVVAWLAGFTPGALGIRLPDLGAFQGSFAFSLAAIAVGAAAFVVMSVQCIRFATSKESRAAAWRQLSEGAVDGVLKDFTAELMLPRSGRERRMFPFVAFTAGICEEFIMRGVAFALVLVLLPGIQPFLLPVLSAALFGCAHAYQGLSGIAKTGAVGLLLGFLYLGTGSLLPSVLLHAVTDLSNECIAPMEGDTRGEEG
ncbi:MAG: CPBP family intramembrane metalloprotease [Clostridiales Family XIII bacterium]|jgi:membrane protease YdiL (CAAX protease family)|nr:CPBP family intramembrane metalloprotease [Clostridiales Family XIII bacterium]